MKMTLTQRAIVVNGHTLYPEKKKQVYWRGHTEPGRFGWTLVSDTPKGKTYRVVESSLSK